jgi:DNA-binding NarL/FixJ family response regulator
MPRRDGPIRVIVADDHMAARAGVRAALDGHGFEVCAEAEDAEGAVQAALRERPDACLLDIRMPGNGITAAARIHAALPGTAIIMLTVSADDGDLFDALRAGALGYLLKGTDPVRLPHAIKGVLEGEAAVPRVLVAKLVDEFRGRGRRRRLVDVELTPREWDVLERLREGATTAEIAERLSVSPVTVRRHVSDAVRKLGVSGREEAVRAIDERSGG